MPKAILPRLATSVWAIWLALIGMLAGMVFFRVGHPHFLPAVSLLIALPLAWLTLMILGLRRLIIGPARRGALRSILVGSVPLFIFSGHVMFGLRGGYGRTFTVNYPVLLLIPVGESIMDCEARLRYPMRTVGDKVIMISPKIEPEFARAQVAAMDAHIRSLEARLGRTMPGTVHWVRGPLFGMEGRALYALCLGSRWEGDKADASVLSSLDRHEVAHCAITLMGPSNQGPPALLGEGWAESCGGMTGADLLIRAADLQAKGEALSLRELTGPAWYGRHQWPVYCQGGPLVNFLIKTYGPEKFFQLYTTSKSTTFADDCQRILGTNLDQLDEAFQAEIERQIGPRGILGSRLASLKTGPSVKHDDWLIFLDKYLKETKELLKPYTNVSMTSERTYITENDGNDPVNYVEKYEHNRLNTSAYLKIDRSGREEALLATPTHSERRERTATDQKWIAEDSSEVSPAQTYEKLLHAIERREPVQLAAMTLLEVADSLGNLAQPETFLITSLELYLENNKKYVRVKIEDSSTGKPVHFRSATFIFSADDHLAAHSTEYVDRDGNPGRTEFEYDRWNGVPVVTSTHATYHRRKGRLAESRLRVLKREFGKTSDSDFTVPALFSEPYQLKPASDPYDDTAWQVSLADFYLVPLLAAALCLILGVARFRPTVR